MKYFSGRDLGTVSALTHGTFEELASALLLTPVELPITKAELLALPHKEQQKAKATSYITPAAFTDGETQRRTENATHCNLLALDIDDATEAKRILKLNLREVLGDLGFVAYHTARSTPEAPRLRIIVAAAGIPLISYPAAVKTIASLLGLAEPTRESLVAVQPMYLPTSFKGDTTSPVFASNVFGDDFTPEDTAEGENPAPAEPSDPTVKDISFLKTPMEDVEVEDIQGALEALDPDCPMSQWIEVGAGLKHQLGEAGYALWDGWSQKGKKYDPDEMESRWRSLRANPSDRAPVTLRSVFRLARARGWESPSLAKKAHQGALDWLRSEARSTEELLDQGCQRIAKVGPAIGTLERKTLLVTLKKRLDEAEMPVGLPDIKRKVKALEMEAAKTGVPPWAKGLCYVTAANVFYRYTTDRRFAPEVIDLMYSVPQIGEDKPMRPRDYLVQVAGVQQVENLRYEPKHAGKRFFEDDGKPYVNIYRSGGAKPNADGAAAAGEIFQRHVAHLIREPDYQRIVIDFLAFHVQHPGRKVRWAVVIQGAQGCGKSFIGSAMAAVIGRRNLRKLTANDVMEGNHNGWAYGQQLIVLEEVRIAGANRYAVMDKLKPCISDDDISIRKLYEPHQTVPNCCNYLMFTNHHDSLAVHDDDRRYFVLASPLQNAEQIAALGGQPYFDQLFGLLRDNAGGLRSWLENWTIGPEFKPDARAPVTPYLRELAEAAASPLSASVQATIEDEPHPLVRKDLLSMGALRQAMDCANLKDFSDQALASVLRELGWLKMGRHYIVDQRHALWTKGYLDKALEKARDRIEFL